MQIYGIKTQLIQPGDNLTDLILNAIDMQGLKIEDGDLVAIASKAVAVVQNQLKRLESIKPSERAKKLAAKHDLEPSFVEAVLQESDAVYGGVTKALFTLKDNILTANAGVDHKNSPLGYVTLWPKKPFKAAENLRKEMFARTGKRVGVLIVDSRVTPLRMGTTGLALAVAGFQPVVDCRGEKDLCGRSLLITRHALADDLASAAHSIMGESNESTPFVLIRNAPVKLAETVKPSHLEISAKECLFANSMRLKSIKEYS